MVGTTTGQVFLGLTTQCARCHDHKSDPFPTADYYRLLAFFRGVRRYSPRTASRPLAAPSAKDLAALAETHKKLEVVAAQIKAIEDALVPHLAGVERDDFLQSDQNRYEIIEKHVPKDVSKADYARYQTLNRQKTSLERTRPQALCVTESGGSPAETFILNRGKSEVAGPGGRARFPLGDRRPLRPRSPNRNQRCQIVGPSTRPGRVDRQSFESLDGPGDGQPDLAAPLRPGDRPVGQRFRLQGDAADPSRIARLAGQRVRRPRVVAQGDASPDRDLERLPDVLPARPQGPGERPRERPTLAVRPPEARGRGGPRLDPRCLRQPQRRRRSGGPSIYPKIQREVLVGQSRPGSGWGQSTPEEQARRSVYIHVKRSLAFPLLASFDAADVDASCPVRFATTQPTQALGLLNGEFLNDQAASSPPPSGPGRATTPPTRVRMVLRRATQRDPSLARSSEASSSWPGCKAEARARPSESLAKFCLLALNLNEFVYLD